MERQGGGERKASRGGPLLGPPHPPLVRAHSALGWAWPRRVGPAVWPRPQHPVPQPCGGPPAAGCRGKRVVARGAGRELAGHTHPPPQELQHAPGPHQPALGVSAQAPAARTRPARDLRVLITGASPEHPLGLRERPPRAGRGLNSSSLPRVQSAD